MAQRIGRAKSVDGSNDIESGYVSDQSAGSGQPPAPLSISRSQVQLSEEHIQYLNQQLEPMDPIDILRLCRILFPCLFQSTAFGLTGLVILDMLSRIQSEQPAAKGIDLIFIDTLYHFPETYQLMDRVRDRYPELRIHVFKPHGVQTVDELEKTFGKELYRTAGDLYDWIVKVEPLQRAYKELRVGAVFNGRRRSQGADRGALPILEMDSERAVIKINPMARWTFDQVQAYVRERGLPYNSLLDQGYRSVGDWHSTAPVTDDEDERAGRWKGQSKTECGIHNKMSRYAHLAAANSDHPPEADSRQPPDVS